MIPQIIKKKELKQIIQRITNQELVWNKIKRKIFKNQKVFLEYLEKVQKNQKNQKRFKFRNKTKYFYNQNNN